MLRDTPPWLNLPLAAHQQHEARQKGVVEGVTNKRKQEDASSRRHPHINHQRQGHVPHFIIISIIAKKRGKAEDRQQRRNTLLDLPSPPPLFVVERIPVSRAGTRAPTI